MRNKKNSAESLVVTEKVCNFAKYYKQSTIMMQLNTLNTLNSSQVMLIQSFASMDRQKDSEELMDVLRLFYAKKLDEEMQQLWDDGTFNQEVLDELRTQHLRA